MLNFYLNSKYLQRLFSTKSMEKVKVELQTLKVSDNFEPIDPEKCQEIPVKIEILLYVLFLLRIKSKFLVEIHET